MGYRFQCPDCKEKIVEGPTISQVLALYWECPCCESDLTGFMDGFERHEKVKEFVERIEKLEKANVSGVDYI